MASHPVKTKDDWCDAYETYIEALNAAKRSAKGYRGHLTVKQTTTNRAIDACLANPPGFASDQAKEACRKLEVALDNAAT